MLAAARLLSGADGPAPKGFLDGTHRMVAPAETVERVRGFMAAMGITRIANITGLDSLGIPVVMVCRPNSRSLAVSQGKGLDLAAAKASALMESVECYHAERISLPLMLGSARDLRHSHRLVDVTGLCRTATSTFHADLPLLWIEGVDLLGDELAWVPYEVVHTNYTFPQVTGSGCFAMTSNGLASGNHLLEAISHGICEIVERDATTLWALGGDGAQRERRLDPGTVDDPGCCWVLDRFARAGMEVAIWETTTDVGIPAFLCVIAERDADPLRSLYTGAGMGCHPARGVALLRALTEAAQSRATLIAGARDDFYRQDYEYGRHPDVLRAQRAQLAVDGPLRDFRAVPTWEGETFAGDVAWELERLRAVGCERVVVVDLSKPAFRLPVVRVVIPGLEGPEERLPGYVPGRRARAVMERAR